VKTSSGTFNFFSKVMQVFFIPVFKNNIVQIALHNGIGVHNNYFEKRNSFFLQYFTLTGAVSCKMQQSALFHRSNHLLNKILLKMQLSQL
jgi:hypothetical protein